MHDAERATADELPTLEVATGCSAEDLVEEALSEAAQADASEHARWARRALESPFEVMDGVDPLDLSQAGWAVIFAANASRSVRDALTPLIEHRRAQAGARLRVFEGNDGFRQGDSKQSFLARWGVGRGPVDPDHLPYYVLLVGSPDTIPFQFQCLLDLEYAVGRLSFDRPEEYRRYVQGVLDVEQGRASRPRRAAVFGPRNLGDSMAALAHDRLALPLVAELARTRGWASDPVLGVQATRARLAELLGHAAPALLFTAGHGACLSATDARAQEQHQGALVCQDWNKTRDRHPAFAEVFGADDVAEGADLRGLILFSMACYSAGTPSHDSFASLNRRAKQIAKRDFVAELPRRLLSNRGGPALAVIGHLDAAFPVGFQWLPEGNDEPLAFVNAARQLLAGKPVGRAMECFGQRYAAISVELTELLARNSLGLRVEREAVARTWQAVRDARGYVLLGDPAVSVGAETAPRPRPALA